MENKKIIIAGGTGFIGTALIKHFSNTNEVIILTRGIKNVKNNSFKTRTPLPNPVENTRYVTWDTQRLGEWAKELEDATLLINLSGKTVNCRYTRKNKEEILNSRVDATRVLGEALAKCISPPRLWINASSATIYRDSKDKPQDEYTGEIMNDFSVQVCKHWEETFFGQRTPFTRKVALRMAITIGNEGIMTPYFNLLKFGLGGRQGNGKQMYSWIHIEDSIRMIEWVASHPEMEGVYNCSSPNPVTNQEFMATLRKMTGYKFGLPAYEWMLRIGAKLIGTEPELVLKSRFVIPTRILQTGFTFRFPLLEDAMADIVNKTPRRKYHLF